ncbi:MAG: DM13 domain-containing protein [Beijerinckiaceae bacterium]|nr:DM13 domain-containing protein [Beijerinckiaceae bacterium]
MLKTLRKFVLVASHLTMLGIGFAAGIYTLPILIAPKGPDQAALVAAAQGATFRAEFRRDLKGSDFFHWGEGKVSLTPERIAHEGKLAPGPDYKLYLVKTFVEDEAEFLAVKGEARLIGDVKTFNGFILDLPPGIDLAEYTTVLVWCETFSEFISAAKYR